MREARNKHMILVGNSETLRYVAIDITGTAPEETGVGISVGGGGGVVFGSV
jgi:hypothetical protein